MFFFLFFSQTVIASEIKPIEIIPISQIFETFKKNKTSTLIKKYKDIKTAHLLIKDPLWMDYGYYFLGQADLEQAVKEQEKKNYSKSSALAQNAFKNFLNIAIMTPFSPFINQMNELLSSCEFVLAENKSKNPVLKKSALRVYERAFERLMNAHSIGAAYKIPVEILESFLKNCEGQSENDLCTHWVEKLASLYSKKSPEIEMITKYFPDIEEKIPLPSLRKLTQAYKTPDSDTVAFDQAFSLRSIPFFEKFSDEFPKSAFRFRGKYWLAHTLETQNKKNRSQNIFLALTQDSPLSFYGILGSYEVSKLPTLFLDASVPLAQVNDTYLQPHEIFHLKRVELLLAAGLLKEAAKELKEFKPRDQLSSPFLMYLASLAHYAHNHKQAFSLLSELFLRGYEGMKSSYVLKLIFPLTDQAEIENHAKLQDLDPILIQSLIKQESAFEEDAFSNSGAAGLMQIMPATALEVSHHLERTSLIGVDTNLEIGTRYFKKLLTQFDNNTVYALAAYNAGPQAVKRWIKDRPAGSSGLEFIESIPYKETREYVMSILRNYYWYTYLIKGETLGNLDQFLRF